MSTLWCLKWYMLHVEYSTALRGFQHIGFSSGEAAFLFSCLWSLENKDWSLLWILSWSLSLKWIHLTSTSWGFVFQEALSYSCSTKPQPQSKFNWIAGRESALLAGSGPYMEVHPTTKHCHIFLPLRNKKCNIYSPMTQNDYTMSALGCKLCWSNRIDSLLFTLVLILLIPESLTLQPMFWNSQSLIIWILLSNSLVSQFASIIHKFPFVVKCF